jgi:hypothetical protein
MGIQNLISAVIGSDLKTSVLTKLNSVKTDLNFLITMLPEQKNDYLKVGNVMLPFLDKIYSAAETHPEIMPAIFDKEEFKKDYQLTKDLAPIVNLLNELTSAVEATLYAANSDTMVEALEVYAAIQQNKDKVAGLDVIAADLKEFFKKSKKTAANTATPK